MSTHPWGLGLLSFRVGLVGALTCALGGGPALAEPPKPRSGGEAYFLFAPEVLAYEVRPEWRVALAPLRPPGSERTLAALARAPASAAAYADAALAYRDTAAAGMTIVWGLTSLAIEPRGKRAAEVAKAIVAVLDARVAAAGDGAPSGTMDVRLAPGATPVFAAKGESLAPFAHIFEGTFGVAVASVLASDTQPTRWDLGRLQRGLAGFADRIAAGEKLAELDSMQTLPHRWLADLRRAGHLEAFVALAFRPAFGPAADAYAAANPAAMREVATYLAAHPLKPRWPIMPDQLLPLPSSMRP